MASVQKQVKKMVLINSTDNEVWSMSREMYVAAMATLTMEITLSTLTNIILVVTIWNSPSLKTPPNSHLINICVNNLLLVLSMLFSAISLAGSGKAENQELVSVCGDLQAFLTIMGFLQYWCIFAAIGHYRSRTLRKPSMPLKIRRKVIFRSILLGWLVSGTIALALVLCFKVDYSVTSWNAFRRRINKTDVTLLAIPNPGQTAMLTLTLMAIVICLAVIISSYYHIIHTLMAAAQSLLKNKVTPFGGEISRERRSSEVSSDNDIVLNKRSYRPTSATLGHAEAGILNGRATAWSKGPFIISSGDISSAHDNFVVHYSKHAENVSIDDMGALENPIRAHEAHRKLRATLSNTSNSTIQAASGGTANGNNTNGAEKGFSDISPAAELQRFQRMKNSCALRNQSWRQDRVSLGSATKNSLVMVSTFLATSMPLCLCSIPGVIHTNSTQQVNNTLLWCTLAFYLNAPAYPVWYLIFSKQVRKCLHALWENFLISMNIRQ